MRRIVMAALLSAAVIVPAAAFAGAPTGDRQDRGWHTQDNGGHGNGGNRDNGGRSQSADRPQQQQQARPQNQPRPQYQPSGGQRSGQWSVPGAQPRVQAQGQGQPRDYRSQGGQRWNGGNRNQAAGQANRDGRNPQWNGRNDRGQQWNRGSGAAGWHAGNRNGWNHGSGSWNRDWRHDNRYDWNRYRYSNRNLFHLPRYYAPYGWDYGYQAFGIGSFLDDVFYAEDYWIDDPYEYHLPEADGPYRWVRYYNDALLVDIETGEVVDEVDNIFW